MHENRIHALGEFLKVVPESIKLKGLLHQNQFSVMDSDHRLIGQLPMAGVEPLQTRFDFDPKTFSIVDAYCSCSGVKKGNICEHISGLANQLVEDHRSGATRRNPLDFLDRHLNLPSFQEAQFQLSIEILDKVGGIEPVIRIHKYIKEGTFGAGRPFTANDSYKFTQGEPADQNLLDYIRNFRQVLFYSNYESGERYNWGFWLSMLSHPRVSYMERSIRVRSAPAQLILEKQDDVHQLLVSHGVEIADSGRYYEVEGGLLVLCQATGQLLLCQMDKVRRDILLEINQFRPKLTRSELLTNLPRLEKLQHFLHLPLPEELSGVIRKMEPKLVLQLDLQAATGFLLRPRITYEGTTARVVANSEGQYLSTGEEGVIERNLAMEQDLVSDFMAIFPFEETIDRNAEIKIYDMDRALALIQWLKEQVTCEVEWLRIEPKIHQMSSVQGLRVQVDSKAWLKIHLLSEDKTLTITHFDSEDQYLAGTNYVSIGDGEWVQVDQQMRQQLNQLKMAVVQEKRSMKLKKAALAVLAEMDRITLEGDKSWLQKIDAFRGMKDELYQLSPLLNAELRNYQLDGFRWLRRMSELGLGACLADDMGLGKTVQALAAILDRVQSGPVLVVAPASVGFNWRDEVTRFAPSLRPVLYSEGRRAKSLSKLKKGDVIIISYALVLKDIEKLSEVRWGTLVLDEAQFIKNALSQTAMAVSQLNREWTLALTGTPLENHLGELWSIFRMLNPELLGTWENYRKVYVIPIEKNRDNQKMEGLRNLIKPFILRRTKQNVLEDLPERSDIILRVEMAEAQRTKYELERSRILTQLDEVDEKIRFKLLAAITRLRQIACHPSLCEERYKGESAKLKLFGELVEELVSESHRVLVFSQFTSFLALISQELNRLHVPHVLMTGETPVKHRQAIIARFQEGEVPVFLVSLRAGGTGLNLTNANYVIHMDPWWNPAVEEQATDRAHRIGQTEAVTVYRLVTSNTIEEAILNIHTRKRDLFQALLDGQDTMDKLSVNDLLGLIRG